MQAAFVSLNILCICLVGFIVSYTDLKKGIIKNNIVFPAIVIAFFLNFLNGFSFSAFLLNGFLAFLFGFILWLSGLWSAGDSKLFLAFALLFPLPFFVTASIFPAFTILINSFVPAFVLIAIFVLFKTSSKQKVDALRQAFKPSLVLSVAVFLFSFYWILGIFLPLLPIQLDFFTLAILLFVLVSCVEFLLPKKSFYFFAAISFVFLFFKAGEVLTVEFLSFFILFLVFVLLLLFFVLRLGFSCFGKPVYINKLKPGMVLLETVVLRSGKLVKKKPLLPSFVNIFSEIKERPIVESGPKGLDKKDIVLLKKAIEEKKPPFDFLLVQETLPFAPIIFAGTVLSFFTTMFLFF